MFNQNFYTRVNNLNFYVYVAGLWVGCFLSSYSGFSESYMHGKYVFSDKE